MTPDPSTVTGLLIACCQGNQPALEQLVPIVYAELRRMARRQMRQQRPGHSLETTALVHEAYLRLAGNPDQSWQNRAHFFAVAATAMRHILVDRARAHQTGKRGGAFRAVTLHESAISTERAAELVALDDALSALAALNPRQGRVVEMRYFGGLSVEETAVVLRVSADTVMRDWRAARVWLHRELSRGGASMRQRH